MTIETKIIITLIIIIIIMSAWVISEHYNEVDDQKYFDLGGTSAINKHHPFEKYNVGDIVKHDNREYIKQQIDGHKTNNTNCFSWAPVHRFLGFRRTPAYRDIGNPFTGF